MTSTDNEPLFLPEGWEAQTKLEMADEKSLAPLEMSLAISRDETPKAFCKAALRSPTTGYLTATCSAGEAHENAHRDMHSAITWPDDSPFNVWRNHYPSERP